MRSDTHHAVTLVGLLADILDEEHDWETYLVVELIFELVKRSNAELGIG